MIDNIVNLTMDNGIKVKVNKSGFLVSKYDIEEHLIGLFDIKKKYNKSEIIKLSSICDCMFDIMFCGINKKNKELSFKLC